MRKLKLFGLAIIGFLIIGITSCQKEPTASFDISKTSAKTGESISFTNTSIDGVTFSWEFGDGGTSSEESPSHIYNKSGDYNVKMQAFSKNGKKTDEATKAISISKPPTEFEITVMSSLGNKVQGATVKLFKTQSDWELETNQVGTTKTTDANGKVLFTNLEAIKYYWMAEKDCENNVNGAMMITTALTANVKNTLTSIVNSTADLYLQNNSSNPYYVYIDGSLYTTMNGGTYLWKLYLPIGTHAVRVLQKSGYVFSPTDQTYNVTLGCGSDGSVTFP